MRKAGSSRELRQRGTVSKQFRTDDRIVPTVVKMVLIGVMRVPGPASTNGKRQLGVMGGERVREQVRMQEGLKAAKREYCDYFQKNDIRAAVLSMLKVCLDNFFRRNAKDVLLNTSMFVFG